MAPPGVGTSRERRQVHQGQQQDDSNPNHRRYPDIVVLDGGFASQLSCHVSDQIDGDVLWSARFLATNKEAVIDAHLDFLRAGADLVMTNSYQASVGGFVEHLKVTEDEAYDLVKESVRLARTACERFSNEFPTTNEPLIVGSVGPYGASLHDGSEYTGSYAKSTSVDTMRQWHIPRIKALLEEGVDVLAFETIPCRSEAVMLVELLKSFPEARAWLAFSVAQDGKSLAYGENFQETARHCYDLNPKQLVAVGVNCCAPRLVQSLLTDINKDRKNNPVPLIVYPNSGESYKVELGWIDRDKCEPVETYVQRWLDLGVTWVGGCCRTYALDVSRIRNQVHKWKNNRDKEKQSSSSAVVTQSNGDCCSK